MRRGESQPLSPRELLGGIYEKVFPPLDREAATTLLEKFARQVARGALDFRRAGDEDGAQAAEETAERFRALANKEDVSEAEYREILPWVETAAEAASASARAENATDRRRANAAHERWVELERLRDFLGKKTKKAA